jgi:hypothetical protein
MKSEAFKTTKRREIPYIPGYAPNVKSMGKSEASENFSLEMNGKLIGRNG